VSQAYGLDPGAGERLEFGDITILVRATAESTGGAYSLFEELPPMLDTPLHVHAHDDELFYVLEGEHVIEVGEREYTVGPGGMVFAPRGIPHSQRRVVPGAGRLLVLTTPAGLDGFFRELAAADSAGTLGPDAYAAASERYGITWL
jgi:mannose-6-phosphate isomerase-like protein (cupin superfamily)